MVVLCPEENQYFIFSGWVKVDNKQMYKPRLSFRDEKFSLLSDQLDRLETEH